MAKTRTPAQQAKHDKKVKLNLAYQRGLHGRSTEKARRKIKRECERAAGVTKYQRKPVAPILTFCLSRMTTKIEYKLIKIVGVVIENTPPFPPYFESVPVVFIRDLKETKRKVGKRFVTDTEYTKWREFHHASPVRDQDNTTSSSPFVLIQAPITAWVACGLHDGLVARDLPREEKPVAKAEAVKRAA